MKTHIMLLAMCAITNIAGAASAQTNEPTAWLDDPATKARLLAASGKNDAVAIMAFEKLVADRPGDYSLRTDLLVLLAKHKKLERALEVSAAAAADFPENSGVWFSRGKILEMSDDATEAEKAYLKSVNLDKRNSMAWNNLALLVEKRGDTDTAVACFSNAFTVSGGSNLSKFNLGRVLILKNVDADKGVELLEEVAASGGAFTAEAEAILAAINAALEKRAAAQESEIEEEGGAI
jgi:Flp pilus assembly protein TadD, contains TPR repeats